VVRQSRRRTDGARILLVEDNEDFRLLMHLTLQDAGYQVDVATCAEDAIRLLERRPYNLLVSDYSLPGCSGLWLLSKALERKLISADATLLVTGDPEAPDIDQRLTVMAKPVDFARLLSHVRTTLENNHVADRVGAAA
jgi:DNA-binding response OmpR family regulator